jgi:hypothetical protein
MPIPVGGRQCRCCKRERILDGRKEKLAERQSLAGCSGAVRESLEPFLEDDSIEDKEAPVRACHRYLGNRSNYLDYKSALAAGLPIGSGEIESAHRYVFQIRLKIAGAWWKMENLSKMVALRVLRANQGWDAYWSETQRKAA